MSVKRAAAIALTREEDLKRTLAQWKRLDLTTLRLKCDTYHLVATGKKDELSARLYGKMEEIINEAIDGEGSSSPSTSSGDDSGDESPGRRAPASSRSRSPSLTPPPSDRDDGEYPHSSDNEDTRSRDDGEKSADTDDETNENGDLNDDEREMQELLALPQDDLLDTMEDNPREQTANHLGKPDTRGHVDSPRRSRSPPSRSPRSSPRGRKHGQNGRQKKSSQSRRAESKSRTVVGSERSPSRKRQNEHHRQTTKPKNTDDNNDLNKIILQELKAVRSDVLHVKNKNKQLEHEIKKQQHRRSPTTHTNTKRRHRSPSPKRSRKPQVTQKSSQLSSKRSRHQSSRKKSPTRRQRDRSPPSRRNSDNDQAFQRQIQSAMQQSLQQSQQILNNNTTTTSQPTPTVQYADPSQQLNPGNNLTTLGHPFKTHSPLPPYPKPNLRKFRMRNSSILLISFPKIKPSIPTLTATKNHGLTLTNRARYGTRTTEIRKPG